MNPRLSRLSCDYKELQELEARSPLVRIERTEGQPPFLYYVTLNCKGVTRVTEGGEPVYSRSHELLIELHDDYPRKAPHVRMLTPVYHPNIAQSGTVCIGDVGDHGYAPSMGLDDLVVRVVQMIRYENFNLSSVFNSLAQDWARDHLRLFPLDTSRILNELR